MTDPAAIVAFLRARLDEDEQTAREAAGAPWVVAEASRTVHVDPEAQRDAKWRWGDMGYVATVEHDYDRAHIARHDPARVLREVEAKRAILSIHSPVTNGWGGDDWQGACAGCGGEHSDPITPKRDDCPHLRALAHVYADHPDYRPAWRP